jgi:ArsR family transcriptional regulator, arsenate/arsenite/antimonite-responsive transcriptional repressor / arsenate reductase (thioredoxin)
MAAIEQVALPVPDIIQFFKALSDETRLAIVRLLALTDLRAGDVVERLQVPANAASYHFKHLRAAGLLRDRRSSLDARDVYYSVDLERLRSLYEAAGGALHPALGPAGDRAPGQSSPERPLRVLFLCTHNSARSQLAEGIMRWLGGAQVEVFSAGSRPSEVHPMTYRMLDDLGIDSSAHSSKPIRSFLDQPFDYIITVCDRVKEECPTFPGDPDEIHWSLPDPAAIEDEAQRWHAFSRVCHELETRIHYLLSLSHPGSGQRLAIRSRMAARQDDA